MCHARTGEGACPPLEMIQPSRATGRPVVGDDERMRHRLLIVVLACVTGVLGTFLMTLAYQIAVLRETLPPFQSAAGATLMLLPYSLACALPAGLLVQWRFRRDNRAMLSLGVAAISRAALGYLVTRNSQHISTPFAMGWGREVGRPRRPFFLRQCGSSDESGETGELTSRKASSEAGVVAIGEFKAAQPLGALPEDMTLRPISASGRPRGPFSFDATSCSIAPNG